MKAGDKKRMPSNTFFSRVWDFFVGGGEGWELDPLYLTKLQHPGFYNPFCTAQEEKKNKDDTKKNS